jgi:hypothetical protein
MCRGQARGQCPFVMRRRLPAKWQVTRICTSPAQSPCNAPTGQSKRPLTSHITQLWRAAHCQDVPAVAQEIRQHGDTQALLGPRQHRGVRGRLQTGLETNSALSAYAACNCVGSAEMPAQSRLWPWASQALMTVLEISITLHPPTIALLYLYRPAFHP